MTDIQTKIFNEYFNNNDNLNSLYNWMIDSSTEDNFHIESSSFVGDSGSKIVRTVPGVTTGIAESAFFDGTSSGLHSDISDMSVVVKENDVYFYTDYDENNANHFIPYIPDNILSAIEDTHKNTITNIFYIYQLYDFLAENPDKIGLSSIDTINFYDFFSLVRSTSLAAGGSPLSNAISLAIAGGAESAGVAADGNVPDKETITCFPSDASTEKSHYRQIITDSANIELTPSLIYICRGIFLVLLYKYILEIYISYFNYIEDTSDTNCDDPCKINTKQETENLIMSKVFHSMNKINYFLSYKLEVKYDSTNNKLVIQNQGANATTSFDSLIPKRHILYNSTDKEYHKINTIITKTNDYYTITSSADLEPAIFNNLSYESKTLYILSKKADHAAKNYNDVRSKLENVNSKLKENKFENQKSITNLNVIKGSFNNIDYLYYITIIITIICLIVIFFAKSEQSRKSHVFIMLIIVSLTYGIIFSFIQKAKEFSESFNTDDSIQNRLINLSNSKFDDYLKLVYMESANYGTTTLYNELESVGIRDLMKSNKENKIIESEINSNDANSTSEWHRLFQRTLFIHTMFLFLIVVLMYLWLSIIMPDISIYLLFITIIACMLLIFYYFRNLHRVVRTEYKQKYWTKMSV
jgi:hypothetical protein